MEENHVDLDHPVEYAAIHLVVLLVLVPVLILMPIPQIAVLADALAVESLAAPVVAEAVAALAVV